MTHTPKRTSVRHLNNPVRPETFDRREAKKAVEQPISRHVKPHTLGRLDKPGPKKP